MRHAMQLTACDYHVTHLLLFLWCPLFLGLVFGTIFGGPPGTPATTPACTKRLPACAFELGDIKGLRSLNRRKDRITQAAPNVNTPKYNAILLS